MGDNSKPIQYEVVGLPEGQQVLIAEFNNAWHILHDVDGESGRWTGRFSTAEDALATLERT